MLVSTFEVRRHDHERQRYRLFVTNLENVDLEYAIEFHGERTFPPGFGSGFANLSFVVDDPLVEDSVVFLRNPDIYGPNGSLRRFTIPAQRTALLELYPPGPIRGDARGFVVLRLPTVAAPATASTVRRVPQSDHPVRVLLEAESHITRVPETFEAGNTGVVLARSDGMTHPYALSIELASGQAGNLIERRIAHQGYRPGLHRGRAHSDRRPLVHRRGGHPRGKSPGCTTGAPWSSGHRAIDHRATEQPSRGRRHFNPAMLTSIVGAHRQRRRGGVLTARDAGHAAGKPDDRHGERKGACQSRPAVSRGPLATFTTGLRASGLSSATLAFGDAYIGQECLAHRDLAQQLRREKESRTLAPRSRSGYFVFVSALNRPGSIDSA